MRIGVFVSSWEQGCCGTAAGVGDEVTWELTWGREWIEQSYGPEEAAGVDFAETHHGGDDAPRVAVTGRIASVDALRQRSHRPDPAGPWTNVVGESTSVAVERLPGHGEGEDEAGWRVRLDVDDGTALPEAR